MNVFLSHNHKDKDRVRPLAERLRAAKLSVWLDEDSIRPGDAWMDKIQQAIDQSDAIVVAVSRNTNSSTWQSSEIAHAIAARRYHHKKVIPVLIDKGAELPFFLRDILYCDLSSDSAVERNFPSLIAAILDTSQKTEIEERAQELRKLQGIEIETELLKQQEHQFEQRRAQWISLLLGVISAGAAALATIPLVGTWIGTVTPSFRDLVIFISGALAGVIGSQLPRLIARRLPNKIPEKEPRDER